jgi:hypothetical protein
LSLGPMPSMPSETATALSSMMQPSPPPGLLLDINLVGAPLRLVFSAFVMRQGGDRAVVDVRHVASTPDALVGRLETLSEALTEAKSLLAKLDAFSS